MKEFNQAEKNEKKGLKEGVLADNLKQKKWVV
jgi:hypothetical protein